MHRQALALLLVCRAVTAGDRRRMAECGTRAFVTRGRVPLGSWQALLPSCGVQGGGRARGGRQGEGTLQPPCPPSSDVSAGECQSGESTLLCHPWNLIISDRLLRRAADRARVSETLKCWEVADIPLHSGLCRCTEGMGVCSFSFRITLLVRLSPFHRTTSFLEKVCAGELCGIVQWGQQLPINARF